MRDLRKIWRGGFIRFANKHWQDPRLRRYHDDTAEVWIDPRLPNVLVVAPLGATRRIHVRNP